MFKPAFLLIAAIIAELIKTLLDLVDCIVRGAIFECWSCSLNPLEQIRGQFLVLVHETLILLINAQHFQDTIGGGLGLNNRL